MAPDLPPLPNFDKRTAGVAGTEPLTETQQAAAGQLRALLPRVRVDFDPVTGAPKHVAATDSFLTGTIGAGTAMSASTTGAIPIGEPYAATRTFLQRYSRLFGHGPEALDTARITRDYATPHNGLRTVVWEQQVDGVAVFEGVLVSHTARRGELVSICSQFLPDPAAAAARGMAAGSASRAAFGVSARRAVVLAARNVGQELAENQLDARGQAAAGAEQRHRFTAPGLKGEAEAKLTWLPMDRQSLRLCWDVVLMSRNRGEMFRELVDASTGEVLLRRCLTSYLTDASYRVFTSDSPSPLSPGHPAPADAQPPLVPRALMTLAALDTNASPAGWIADGDNETVGNNVDAHTDWNADDAPDLPRPQGSPFRVFDFAADLGTEAPADYASAAVVQLFYVNNWIHDRLYQLGFTEAAGNFQNNNFSRGGLGNDAVQADAQDGNGTDNANFSTPPDGSPGRMQMYIFTRPSPRRDGDFDAEVVVHEYTHGLSWRLVGGGQALGDTQSDGLGEGWSDFYALALLSEAGDDVDGCYAAGAYISYLFGGAADTENYYFGIRRYPYTTDLDKNPLTFKDLDPAQADYCSSGAPFHTGLFGPCSSPRADEAHNAGEVWCVALWEARANLINQQGWETGNQLLLQLVTDGMRLTPPHPNFLQARDAILQADLVNTGGANQNELWAAFAKRGLGFSATSPASTTTAGIREAFDLPDDLRASPAFVLSASGVIGGPFTPVCQTYTLTNAGSKTLAWAATNRQSWVTVSSGGGSLPAGSAISVDACIAAAAGSLPPGTYADTIVFSNLNNGRSVTREVTLSVTPPPVWTFALDSDPGWSRQGEWAFGAPAGSGGAAHGGPDPAGAATGSNVFGINLNGDYSTPTGEPHYLTAGPFDLRHYTGTRLQFERWLNTDYFPYVHATVEVSSDGTSWDTIWSNGSAEIADAAWTRVSYDVSACADDRANVYVRWGHRVTSSGAWAYSGWNLDDIQLLGLSTRPLNILLPGTAAEVAGLLTAGGTLRLTAALPTNLVVSLTSSVPSRLFVPPTATIAAGQLAGSFNLTLRDNPVHDGDQTVFITAGAEGFTNVSSSVVVLDDEVPPRITVQPTSQTVLASNSVTFSVTAIGKAPLSYSWIRDGSPIEGGTASSYATHDVQLADSGSTFSCRVSNEFGTALSSSAVLTVVTTPANWFTEWFDQSLHLNDLAYQSFTFTPDGGPNFYSVCRQAASSFPTDPAGGTTVPLGDDFYAPVTLTGTNAVAIYDQRTNVFFIGSNGYLTTSSGDSSYTPSFANHFNRPRISGWFRDLDPGSAGAVSWRQLNDRVAVTFQDVPEYGKLNTNSFQMELFGDGRIRVTYLQVDAQYGLAGLSAGQGIPALFVASDLSTCSACAPLPPALHLSALVQTNGILSLTWNAATGQSYQVQYRNVLLGGEWLNLGDPIVATDDAAGARDPLTNAQRFYRVIRVAN